MKKFWTISLALIAIMVIVASGTGMLGTNAWFFDQETSPDNSFTAGTLDLKINGGDTPYTLFNVSNMAADAQPTGSITLKNTGSISGGLSISGVTITRYENGCNEPESSSGDATCENPGEGQGELQNVLNLRLYIDNAPITGYYGFEDTMLYNGLLKDLGATIPISKTLTPGAEARLNYVVDWWDTPSDNLAQSDGLKLDMVFGLDQAH